MSYEDKLCHFFKNHSRFLGILAGVHELYDFEISWRLTSGSGIKPATVVIRMRSPNLTKPYYSVLRRHDAHHVEWFDPTGTPPPHELLQWCKDYDFKYLNYLTYPTLAPDRLFLSGEMCAYYVKQRKWYESFESFQSRYFYFAVGDTNVLALSGIDFSRLSESRM
jgi:hypothetical protein